MSWEKLLEILPTIATEPLAILAYTSLASGWLLWLYRRARSGDFLKALEFIEAKDRPEFSKQSGYSYSEISRLPRKDQLAIINRKYLLIAYAISITSFLVFVGLLFNYLKLSAEDDNDITRIPTGQLAMDVVEIIREQESQSRKNYKNTKSAEDFRRIVVGFPYEDIYKRLFEKYGRDTKNFSSLTKRYNFVINDVNNYLVEHHLVNFVTETSQRVDDKPRLSDQTLYMQLAFHKKALLAREMAAAKSRDIFLIKARYKTIRLEYVGNTASVLATVLPMRTITFISEIEFLEIDHAELGPFRLSIDSAIMEYLKYNTDSPNKENCAHVLNVLGHVFYSGLLGQRVDRSRARDYFVRSMEISEEIFNENLIASNSLILAYMFGVGEGGEVDLSRANRYLISHEVLRKN